MNNNTNILDIKKAVSNSIASVEIEGFRFTNKDEEMCISFVLGEITKQEYINLLLAEQI